MAAQTASAAALHAQQRAEHLASRFPPLLVAAERVAMTVAQGVHGRRRVGQGEAFWQFRRYQPHDGADQIDWRQTAKSDHVYVRETEWEASQSVWLWRDVSASMRWRSNARLPEKAERADLLTLSLMALLIRGGELVALLGEGARPATGRATLNRLAQVIVQTPADSAGLPPETALPRYAQVVVIGDFLSPLEQVAAAIGRIAGRDVKGFLVQLLDPAEQTLPFAGRTRFEGLEAEGDMLVPRVEAVRQEYRELFEAHVAGLQDIARQVGWNFLSHRTDHPPETAVLALFQALAKPSYR